MAVTINQGTEEGEYIVIVTVNDPNLFPKDGVGVGRAFISVDKSVMYNYLVIENHSNPNEDYDMFRCKVLVNNSISIDPWRHSRLLFEPQEILIKLIPY